MWELDHKESWEPKNWCFWTVVLEKTLERPLDCKKIKLINPKRNQSLIFIARTDAEAEASILGPPNTKNWFIGKDPDAGKDWRQEEKGMTEDKMVGWHDWLDGHEFEQAPGVGDGQVSLGAAVHGVERVRHYWATELIQSVRPLSLFLLEIAFVIWDLVLLYKIRTLFSLYVENAIGILIGVALNL